MRDEQPIAIGQHAQACEHEERLAPKQIADEREEQIELHFDAKRPKGPADAAERVKPERMQEGGVRGQMRNPRACRREPRSVRYGEDRERYRIRWQNFFGTPHSEVRDRRQRLALEHVASVWIEQAEAAHEEKKIDAHESRLRQRLQVERVVANAQG